MENRSRVFYVILSVLASAMIWLYVDAKNATQVTVDVDNVPVVFLYEDSTLADRGLMLLQGKDTTISLRLRASRSVISNLDTSAITANVDMSSIMTSGFHSMNYTVAYPENIAPGDVTTDSASVYSILVRVGELFRREVEIRAEIDGEVADGYTAGTLSLYPSTLEVRGQQADVLKVAYAKVILPLDKPSDSVREMLSYELYDKNGNVVEGVNLRADRTQVEAHLPVLLTKRVPLSVTFIESDGAHLDNVDYTILPQSISVTGEAAAVRAIDSIDLGTISLEDVVTSGTYTYDIKTPAGVSNISSSAQAKVTVVFKDMVSRSVVVSDFVCENVPEGCAAAVRNGSVVVTLRGTSEDLALLQSDEVSIVLDLSDIPAARGTYTVDAAVRIESAEDIDLGVVGTYPVIVQIEETPAAADENAA
ncbi:MAG: hypothetical protein IJF15_03915 [Oscillospiraceae bacterium]|nr:hypothetical protein [Oscillospiraceae bacterium]